MDREQEVNAKVGFARQEQLKRTIADAGAPTAFGLAQDQASPGGLMYSPRLALLSRVDRLTDDLLEKVSRLREFRKQIEHGNDRDASFVEQAITALEPPR